MFLCYSASVDRFGSSHTAETYSIREIMVKELEGEKTVGTQYSGIKLHQG